MALLVSVPIVKSLLSQPHNRCRLTSVPSDLYAIQCNVLRTRTNDITTNEHSKRNVSRIVNRALESGDLGRVQGSEVADKRPREVYTPRTWDELDIYILVLLVGLHLLCGFAPFTFNWRALWLAAGLYVVTLMGITLSFHRHLSHKSFKIPKWLEYAFTYCGVHAFQGDPIYWVRIHRYHHLYCDSEGDPHSPVKGFWFSYITWQFNADKIPKACGEHKFVDDLERQPFYEFLQKTYILHPLALAGLLYAVGGFPFIVWGMGVRTVCLYHITWLVNAVCHGHGQQSWNTCDLSRNIWWIGILSFGEGWHNNHHAFQYSAKFGLEWWQIDIGWYVIRLLEIIGLATDVQLSNPTEVKRQSSCSCHSFEGLIPSTPV